MCSGQRQAPTQTPTDPHPHKEMLAEYPHIHTTTSRAGRRLTPDIVRAPPPSQPAGVGRAVPPGVRRQPRGAPAVPELLIQPRPVTPNRCACPPPPGDSPGPILCPPSPPPAGCCRPPRWGGRAPAAPPPPACPPRGRTASAAFAGHPPPPRRLPDDTHRPPHVMCVGCGQSYASRPNPLCLTG